MNRSVPQEFGVREAGNHSQYTLLLRNSQSGLETDDIPHIAISILATQLNDCPWTTARSRIGEPDGLQRSEAKRIRATLRRDFDRHTSFEVRDFVELMSVVLISRSECRNECLVFIAAHRAVEVCPVLTRTFHRLPIPARRGESDRLVDRVAGHNGRDRVIESQRTDAEPLTHRPGQRV